MLLPHLQPLSVSVSLCSTYTDNFFFSTTFHFHPLHFLKMLFPCFILLLWKYSPPSLRRLSLFDCLVPVLAPTYHHISVTISHQTRGWLVVVLLLLSLGRALSSSSSASSSYTVVGAQVVLGLCLFATSMHIGEG